MTPPTISPEARNCAEKVDEAQFRKHLGHIPYQDCIAILSNEIQLAINTSTEALAKENAELRQSVHELNETLRRAGWGQGEIDSSYSIYEELEIERDQLQARVKELEGR